MDKSLNDYGFWKKKKMKFWYLLDIRKLKNNNNNSLGWGFECPFVGGGTFKLLEGYLKTKLVKLHNGRLLAIFFC